MLTGELRNKVDRIWEVFWTGGITNPLEVIEQFTYLLFIKQLDDVETTKESEAFFLDWSIKEYSQVVARNIVGINLRILGMHRRFMILS